jgi:hypothetical protein
MTSNTSLIHDRGRPLRRSTRLNRVIPFTVEGLDSYRGPYREKVSTVTISCHGCRYESTNEVFPFAWVILEIPPPNPDSPPTMARGIVKWIERSLDDNGPQQTAIELEEPGNIWGIDAPPSDWANYCSSGNPVTRSIDKKPIAIREADASASVVKGKRITPSRSIPSTDRSLGQSMGDFQRQMEQLLLDAANSVVRKQTTSALNEIRVSMRNEAKCLFAEAATTEVGIWRTDFVKQIKQASSDSARALHTAWTKKINTDLEAVWKRVDERKRDLDQYAQNISVRAIERVQGGLKNLRRDAVNRIVEQLKEQIAPVVHDAKNATADLSRNREVLEKIIVQALENSSVRMEEICTRLEKQFEMIIQSHLDDSREDLQRASKDATNVALKDIKLIAQHRKSEAQVHFEALLEPVAANVLIDMKEGATETSGLSAFSDLAKGLGRQSKE